MEFKNSELEESLCHKTESKLVSRRDVLKATWTMPVIFAVSPSLEVLAGSGPPSTTGDEGLTPGLWRQINNTNNDNGKGNDPSQNAWDGVTQADPNITPTTKYSVVFGVQTSFGDNLTLGETAALKGGGEKALARHATAGLLNAVNPDINYPYTRQQVIQMVQTAYQTGDFETPKNLLDAANNLGVKDK